MKVKVKSILLIYNFFTLIGYQQNQPKKWNKKLMKLLSKLPFMLINMKYTQSVRVFFHTDAFVELFCWIIFSNTDTHLTKCTSYEKKIIIIHGNQLN